MIVTESFVPEKKDEVVIPEVLVAEERLVDILKLQHRFPRPVLVVFMLFSEINALKL